MSVCVNGNPATGAQTGLFYIAETAVNEVPKNPKWKPLRYTGGIPQLTREVLQSNELDGVREINDVRGGSQNATGDINVELSHLSHVDLIAAALQSQFKQQPSIELNLTTLSFSAQGNVMRDTNVNGGIFEDVRPGRVINVTGTANNNGQFTVATVVDKNTVTVNETLTDEAAGANATLEADAVKSVSVGSCPKTFSLLVVYNDLAENPSYDIITGVEFTGFSVTLATNAIATASFSTIGRGYQPEAQLPSGSTFAPAPNARPYTGLDGAITLDGKKLGIVTSMSPTLDNNADPTFAIGSRGVAYVEYGRAKNTFDLATAFTNYDLFRRFIDETRSRVSLRLELDGNFLEFVYPRVQLTAGSPNPKGEGTITIPVSVQALRDPDVGSSVVISYND